MDREQGEGHEFLQEATQVENIWVLTGEVGDTYLVKKTKPATRAGFAIKQDALCCHGQGG